MAKKSQIARDNRRAKLIEKYRTKRAELTAIIKNPESSSDERELAYKKLASMPRDASSTRLRNRCRITGRSRGYLRKFEMSRIKFRELSHKGEIPGVTKASW
jgi:small subunit ribosomal protein S14